MMRGTSVTLTADLPGVNKNTILAIPRINSDIRVLELSGLAKIPDSVFATMLQPLTSLQVLVLR